MASIQFYCVGGEPWRAECPEGGAQEGIWEGCTFPSVGTGVWKFYRQICIFWCFVASSVNFFRGGEKILLPQTRHRTKSNSASPTESSAHAPRPASIGFSADCSTRSRACAIHAFIARYFFFRFRFRYDAFSPTRRRRQI